MCRRSLSLALKSLQRLAANFLKMRSPQMLMASGIGPKSTLQQQGIDVLVDLPGVGQNMWVSQFLNSSRYAS